MLQSLAWCPDRPSHPKSELQEMRHFIVTVGAGGWTKLIDINRNKVVQKLQNFKKIYNDTFVLFDVAWNTNDDIIFAGDTGIIFVATFDRATTKMVN